MTKSLGLCLLLASLAATAPAQLSGSYTVGTGGAYPTMTAAAAALSAGVSGPVRFVVLPGVYTESFSLGTVPGASSTNTVTFVSLVPGAAKLTGATGTATCTFTLATSTTPTGWYVLDGLEFTGGPGPAIHSDRYVNDVEIRNCTFLAGHTTYILDLRGANISRWKVHHNKFTLIPNQRGCYLSQIDDCLFYDNEFDLNGCSYGWYAINTNNSRNRAFNNLFYGSIQDSTGAYGLYMAASQYDWEVSLNTFVVNTGSNGNLIQLGGCCTIRMTNFYGNVFVNLGTGPFYRVAGTGTVPVYTYYRGDGNVFYSPSNPNPTVALVTTATGNVPYDLAGWQGLTSQDAASTTANPLLINVNAPPFDLRPLPVSPVKDKAVPFPGYATLPAFAIEDDFAGTIRGTAADIGAYEVRPEFGRFRSGCAGTGSLVPEIGSTGTLAVPSANFGVTLSNALGGTPGAFTLGTSATTWGPFALPYAIGGGCSIQTNLSLVLPIPVQGSGPGNGTATVPLPIPNDPTLFGASLFAQWLIVDPASGSPFGVTTTRTAAIQF